MKKRAAVLLVAGILLLLGTGNVFAESILERIHTQQQRIDQGIASGTLTRHEADTLQDNLNWIKARFARLKADGRLTAAERAKLDSMLKKNSMMISNKKKNPVGRVYGDDLQARIHGQQKRIDQGIASGALTRREANMVQDNLNWVKNRYAKMKADGRLSRKEAQKLERMLKRNGEMIANKKHNPIRKLY